MTLLYADTSAVIRAYFQDEPDHQKLRDLLLQGSDLVITSELTRVEFASAVHAAARAGRHNGSQRLLDQFDEDCSDDGPIIQLGLDASAAFPIARTLVTRYPLRAMDAIHLAVLTSDGIAMAGGEPIVFVTRDKQQADAARELGIPVLG